MKASDNTLRNKLLDRVSNRGYPEHLIGITEEIYEDTNISNPFFNIQGV
jgi:hypothetical protein